MGTWSPSTCPHPVSNKRRECPSRVNWFASRQPHYPHCQSISRACPLTRRASPFSRPSFALTSASQNCVSRGLIASIAASCSCFCTAWMVVLRSSPLSFTGTHCLLIVLNTPRRRCDVYQLRYHFVVLQLSFSFFFPNP